jgi:nucleotide-binding universal stress UspA family protein
MGAFELGTDGPGAIVVGVDGSPTSLRAASYAAGMARRQHTKLIAVYARTIPSSLLILADHSGMSTHAVMETQDELERQLRSEVEKQAALWGLDAELIVRQGEPLAVLSQVAKEKKADAVIVGSSAGVGHRLAGSLAVKLVRCARWPVTVVP